MPSFRARVALVCGGLAALGSPGLVLAQGDPAVPAYVEAFNSTCRHGFPNLDAVATVAARNGWEETGTRAISGTPPAFAANLPRVFRKDGLMLFLTQPAGGDFKPLCQVTGSAGGTPNAEEVVTALSPTIQGFEPRPENDGDHEGAIWQFGNKIEIQPGTVKYRRNRSISLLARERR